GRYCEIVVGSDTFLALILAVSVPSDRRLTVNIPNPGILIGVSSVRLYYYNYAVELRLKIGQPTGTADYTVTLTTSANEIDIAPTLRKYWQRMLLDYPSGYEGDQLTYVYATREVYLGSATSFSSDSSQLVAVGGKLIAPQLGVSPVMLTARPAVSYVKK